MNFLKEVIQIYIERKDWFLELIAVHIGLSLVAILCAGVIGLLLGIWISEHEKAAGPVLAVANVFYTIHFSSGNADPTFRNWEYDSNRSPDDLWDHADGKKYVCGDQRGK